MKVESEIFFLLSRPDDSFITSDYKHLTVNDLSVSVGRSMAVQMSVLGSGQKSMMSC